MFLSSIVDAFSTKPAAQPAQPQLPRDIQQDRRLAAIEDAKLRQADDTRRAQLSHHLNTEERRTLTEQRDKFVESRQKAGKPLATSERHVVDCELELALAQKSYDRDHGKSFVLGDGSMQMSHQKSRLVSAERALKSAKATLERVRFMTSPAGVASTYLPDPDLSGYLNHKTHVADVMATIKK
jgi:hypothetical protein